MVNLNDNLNITLYLSPKHSSKLRIKESSDENTIKSKGIGHVFAFFSKNSTLLNLGKNIEHVKFFDANNKSGLLIKYYNGDKCLTDPNLYYQTYLFMKCEKDNYSNIPELLGTVNSIF